MRGRSKQASRVTKVTSSTLVSFMAVIRSTLRQIKKFITTARSISVQRIIRCAIKKSNIWRIWKSSGSFYCLRDPLKFLCQLARTFASVQGWMSSKPSSSSNLLIFSVHFSTETQEIAALKGFEKPLAACNHFGVRWSSHKIASLLSHFFGSWGRKYQIQTSLAYKNMYVTLTRDKAQSGSEGCEMNAVNASNFAQDSSLFKNSLATVEKNFCSSRRAIRRVF